MGIVKKKPVLEHYLDLKGAEWRLLSDKEYINLTKSIKNLTEHEENYSVLYGDKAFDHLQSYLPFSGYIYSLPHHSILSIYSESGESTIGYWVSGILSFDREKLNLIECLFSNSELDFAYMFNHEWQAMCPEVLIKKVV